MMVGAIANGKAFITSLKSVRADAKGKRKKLLKKLIKKVTGQRKKLQKWLKVLIKNIKKVSKKLKKPHKPKPESEKFPEELRKIFAMILKAHGKRVVKSLKRRFRKLIKAIR